MTQRHYALVALIASLAGCALTLSGGAGHAAGGRPLSRVTALGLSSHAFRYGGGVFGVRLASTLESRGLALRSATLHAGYDLRLWPGRLVLEPGFDIGAGSPLAGSIAGIGSYAGVSSALRLRLFGVDDSEPAYNVYAAAFELVLLPRVGAWMPPERADHHGLVSEWSVELGVRIALGSDLVAAAQGSIADAESQADDSDGGVP